MQRKPTEPEFNALVDEQFSRLTEYLASFGYSIRMGHEMEEIYGVSPSKAEEFEGERIKNFTLIMQQLWSLPELRSSVKFGNPVNLYRAISELKEAGALAEWPGDCPVQQPDDIGSQYVARLTRWFVEAAFCHSTIMPDPAVVAQQLCDQGKVTAEALAVLREQGVIGKVGFQGAITEYLLNKHMDALCQMKDANGTGMVIHLEGILGRLSEECENNLKLLESMPDMPYAADFKLQYQQHALLFDSLMHQASHFAQPSAEMQMLRIAGQAMRQEGIDVERSYKEQKLPGRYETVLDHDDIRNMYTKIPLARSILAKVARDSGFALNYQKERNGRTAHCHFSIVHNGENIFTEEKQNELFGQAEITEEGLTRLLTECARPMLNVICEGLPLLRQSEADYRSFSLLHHAADAKYIECVDSSGSERRYEVPLRILPNDTLPHFELRPMYMTANPKLGMLLLAASTVEMLAEKGLIPPYQDSHIALSPAPEEAPRPPRTVTGGKEGNRRDYCLMPETFTAASEKMTASQRIHNLCGQVVGAFVSLYQGRGVPEMVFSGRG